MFEGLLLFDGGEEVLGDLGPRAAADTHCDTHPNKPVGSTAVAFASFNVQQEIRDLPQLEGFMPDQPVVGPNGILSASWDALLDGDLDMSLVAAGVLPQGAYWLSGAIPDGSLDASGACSGFTNTNENANAGQAEATDSNWIFHHGGGCWQSTTHYHRLCLAY